MEIHYDLTHEDYWAFVQHAAARDPWRFMDYIWALMPYALVYFIGRSADLTTETTLILSGFVAATWLFLASWVSNKRAMAVMDGGPGSLGLQTMRIAPDGLYVSDAVSESRTSWVGIRRFCHDLEHFFIYVDRRRGFIVPKRAFPTPDAAAAFATLAKEYLDGPPAPQA